MTDRALFAQLDGYGLTTAEIHYYRPGHPSPLQLFVWRDYDLPPDFPALFDLLAMWRRQIEAALHSIRIAHDALIGPAECRAAEIIRLID